MIIKLNFVAPRILYHDTSKPIPQWVYGYRYYFAKKAWIDALLWIFLVIPIAGFVYWVWEPGRLRKYRWQAWAFVLHKCGIKRPTRGRVQRGETFPRAS